MNVDKIKKRTKRFLKKTPLRDKNARQTMARFPQWKDDVAKQLAVETLIILHETYKGTPYRMGVLEAYHEAIKIYSQRWIDWQIATDKGGDEDEFEADSENSD